MPIFVSVEHRNIDEQKWKKDQRTKPISVPTITFFFSSALQEMSIKQGLSFVFLNKR